MSGDDRSSDARSRTGSGDVPPEDAFLACLRAVLRAQPAASVAWICAGHDGGPVLWDLYRALPATTASVFRRGWAVFSRGARGSDVVEAIGRIVATDAGGSYFAELLAAAPWHDPARVELTGPQLARVLRRERLERRERRARRRGGRSSPTVAAHSSARLVSVPEITKKLVALGEVDRSGDPVTAKAVRLRLGRPGHFPPEYAELAATKVNKRYPERAALAFLAAAARRLEVDRAERERIEKEIAAVTRRTRADRA